jgi:hypothetical protein
MFLLSSIGLKIVGFFQGILKCRPHASNYKSQGLVPKSTDSITICLSGRGVLTPPHIQSRSYSSSAGLTLPKHLFILILVSSGQFLVCFLVLYFLVSILRYGESVRKVGKYLDMVTHFKKEA